MAYEDGVGRRPRPRWKLVGKAVLVGLASGAVVCLYRLLIAWTGDGSRTVYEALLDEPLLIPIWILLAIAAGMVIRRIVEWEPASSGSGIPQVKGNVMLGHRMHGGRILASRFAGGLLGSIFGLSLGREGPSVHIGAATEHVIFDRAADDELERRMLMTSGAAAGLSAAFSAPLAGTMFALEEIHHSLSEYVILAGISASVAADLVAMYIFGMDPVLQFAEMPEVGLNVYVWLIPCGIVGGLLGSLMNVDYIGMKKVFEKIPPRWRVPVAMVAAACVGLVLPDVLGGGEGLVEIAERGETALAMVLLLLIVKIVFSGASFGCGAPGGIFMPILAVGALGGCATGMALESLGMPEGYVADCAVMVMAGTLASSLRTPVTAIILVVEMTGSLIHLLPFAFCVLIAYVLSGMLGTKPMYRLLLQDLVEKNPGIAEGAGEKMETLMARDVSEERRRLRAFPPVSTR